MERRILYLNHIEFSGIVPDRISTVLVPVGTIEAHGITPLGTDVIIPEAMASRIAKEVDALIAPTIPYGITRGLLGHPGTLHISPQSFKSYVSDVLKSLANAGFKSIIILNGHGGQTDELKQVAFETSRDMKVRTLLIDWWYETDEIRNAILGRESGHAGADETASIMAIDASLVKEDLYRENMTMKYSKQFSAYPFPTPIISYTSGDTSLNLDMAKCKQYYDAVTSQICDLIKKVLRMWQDNISR
ncbi:MAG: creatininase family protein [bacterium]